MFETDVKQGEPAGSRASRLAGCAVALWSVLYLAPHLFWALGGTAGFTALRPSVAALPQWRTINWIASAILAVAALLGIALRHPRRSTSAQRAVLAVAWLGSCVGTAHGLVGIAMRIQTLAGRPSGTQGPVAWLYWDLLVFEPWFLIEGVLLAVAGGALLQDPQQRKLWTAACAAGTGIAIVLAFLRVKIG